MSDDRRQDTPSVVAPVASLVTASMASNLLMLTGPLFMLQVYDRVLSSGSLPTLWVLTALVAVLFAFYGFFEVVRARLASRIAEVVDLRLRDRLFAASVHARLVSGAGLRVDPTRDGETLRQFISGPAPMALLDVPWVPVYLAVVFVLHPTFGWLAVGGACVTALLLVVGERIGSRRTRLASEHALRRQGLVEEARQAPEAVVGMGMVGALQRRLAQIADEGRAQHLPSTDRAAAVSATSRSFRFFLQSGVLAVGAYLALQGEVSPGVMIAASVVTSRALAPVDQVVAQWRGITGARLALGRVRAALSAEPERRPMTALPPPRGAIDVRGAATAPPMARAPLVGGVTLHLEPGDGLAVVGPSGAGKSSLARMLVGAWPVLAGEYRLDGAELAQYDPRTRGTFIGYLPQDSGLASGTVAENIARFEADVPAAELIDAARLAQAHDLIVRLPDGYDTQVGPGGQHLSAGQRQRIGLARALFRSPHLVVLDEPNSNLDQEGEAALAEAIRTLRARGSIVVVVAHRRRILECLSHVLVVQEGRQTSFGPVTSDQAASERPRPIRTATG